MPGLLKIPFVVAAIAGLHTAATPPLPPPEDSEKVPSTKFEGYLNQRTFALMIKYSYLLVGLAEIVAILAHTYPSCNLSSISFVRENVPQQILRLISPSQTGSTGSYFSKLSVVGTSLIAIGGLLRWHCYKALGKHFTFEMSIQKDHRLVTTGLYNVVRHPGYSGAMCVVVGIITWYTSEGSWVRESGILDTGLGRGLITTQCAIMSSLFLGLVARMSKEDQALKQKFGKQWDAWAERVPYSIIPWVY